MSDDTTKEMSEEAAQIYNSLHASIKIMHWIFIKAVEEGFNEPQALHICGIYLSSMIKSQGQN